MSKLTPKQKAFVAEFMICRNATEAARRAGYSEKTARAMGAENLTKPNIAAEIKKREEKLQSKLEITAERVLEEIAAIGFANATDFVTINANGLINVKATSQMPKEKLGAIAGIKYSANGLGVEIKLHDKPRALEMLAKYLGLFDTAKTPDTAENNIFDVINQATGEELDTSAISEIEPPAKPGDDMVE